MRTLGDLDLQDKRVLIRADLDGTGRQLNRKILAATRAINQVLSRNGRPIVASHLSPVDGGLPTLEPVGEVLSSLLGRKVKLVRGPAASWSKEVEQGKGEVILLENMMLHSGERTNSLALANHLASLADVYVNDDFSSSTFSLASTVGVADRIREVAIGPRLWDELDQLDKSMNDPIRPMVTIVGGDDVRAKLRTVRHMVTRSDRLLIGGAVAFVFLEAQGLDVGLASNESDLVEEAQAVMEIANEEGTAIVLPTDVIMAMTKDEDAEGEVFSVKEIDPRSMALDIGPESINHFLAAIKDAKTIIWNGTMGAWELEQFSEGTRAMAFAVANSHAYTVAGGRGTINAVEASGDISKINHASLGGDAFKAMLSGERLPGVEKLSWRARGSQK
ncbi:MAG: phosphoglycerate kinase [Candidatus Saccharibacteria bacterium]